MTITTGIIAYFLIFTPVAVLIGDALQKHRRSLTAPISILAVIPPRDRERKLAQGYAPSDPAPASFSVATTR